MTHVSAAKSGPPLPGARQLLPEALQLLLAPTQGLAVFLELGHEGPSECFFEIGGPFCGGPCDKSPFAIAVGVRTSASDC